ncbi:hypothetical protein QVD17_00415 [Tagetes erecta]|uniref:Uncharacterized protein n=1 Tax=Tagetes erecta TaxID=13708 RepID=A0AAD8L8L1_TARER|nr:hypothetical protein QVD17_00415 [Tagetes erecta]
MGENTPKSYILSKAIEVTFEGSFNWKMVKVKQQHGGWECGFEVIRNMFEFVTRKQFEFPNNIWNSIEFVTQSDIDKLVNNVVSRFLDAAAIWNLGYEIAYSSKKHQCAYNTFLSGQIAFDPYLF